ncbi:putative c2h2 finger domain protein [Erysiphe neolycopersici]|uniref:Putative c2h2 finger domain protein n=1 Tax=Erysiphe neolycopersici TaxID=212602 RepID=A0A420HEB8_9PEZI|nr:putative c2h2 finger domain protein [Erysiphe neolycopersici]
MASSKDNSNHSSRPLNHQRLSISNNNPLSKSHTRINTHLVTTGSNITNHRVTRRKSITTNSTSTAIAAAVKEAVGSTQSIPIIGRKLNTSQSSSCKFSNFGLPSPPMSLPTQTQKIRLTFTGKSERLEESAIVDDDDRMYHMGDEDGEEGEEPEKNSSMSPQARRASEGQHLMKDGKKPSSSDLKCDKCGKEYKHSSCLSKHLWEHTPEWSYTSKLLISKHQQVQLLEAASVLLNMTQDVATNISPTQDFYSDRDSVSASSEQNDHLGSADTTPPPQTEMYNTSSKSRYISEEYNKIYDGHHLSHSFRSASSTDFFGRELLSSAFSEENCKIYFDTYQTPPENGRNYEDESLASAVQLLSCSFGSTGNSMPTTKTYPQQIPPVPSLPKHYLDNDYFPNSRFTPGHLPQQPESYTRSQVNYSEDVQMENGEITTDDEEYDQRSSGRSNEDDEGIFGRMED